MRAEPTPRITPMSDLFESTAATLDFTERAIVPAREIGAYEALWMQKGATFKTLANRFRMHPEAMPSDLVEPREAEQYARDALDQIRAADIPRFGIRVNGAGEYPARLRDAAHPIELLYYCGNWDLTSTRCVAIVGTRHPSEDGERRAAKLARGLVRAKFTIVSGLAQGIDTAAHRAAIEAGGRTIAVLGTPITACYPPANAALQRRIAAEFLVVSQVPIVRYSKQSPLQNRLFFPERNATISALTEATIIVEAGNTSGTLIQARHALQQGRKLLILDSCLRNPELTWPARFLARGAARVATLEDIMRHLAP